MAAPEFDPQAEVAAIAGAIGSENFEKAPRFVDEENPNRPMMLPKHAIDETLAEAKADRKKQQLTWDKREDYRTPQGKPIPLSLNDRVLGAFDGRLPSMGPYFGYWVQNGRIFYGKSREVRLEEVPEKTIWRGKVERNAPPEVIEVEPRKAVARALEVMKAKRVAADPLICRVCREYRASSPLDYSLHFAKEHPAELAQIQAALEGDAIEAEPSVPPPATPPKKKRTVLSPSA